MEQTKSIYEISIILVIVYFAMSINSVKCMDNSSKSTILYQYESNSSGFGYSRGL